MEYPIFSQIYLFIVYLIVKCFSVDCCNSYEDEVEAQGLKFFFDLKKKS